MRSLSYPEPQNVWQLQVGIEIGVYGLPALHTWAAISLADTVEDRERFCLVELMQTGDIAGLSARHFKALSVLVNIRFPEFDPDGDDATQFAKSLWFSALRQYISGKGNPDEICALVAWIEVRFDYPRWPGNMYNACDCVPNDRSLCPHLEDEARLVLSLHGGGFESDNVGT